MIIEKRRMEMKNFYKKVKEEAKNFRQNKLLEKNQTKEHRDFLKAWRRIFKENAF